MLPEYRTLPEQAVNRKKENKAFLERLKKADHRPGPDDQSGCTMRAFQHIDCLQCGKLLPDHRPPAPERDVDRLARTFPGYVPPSSPSVIFRIDGDGDYVFRRCSACFLAATTIAVSMKTA